MTPNIVKVSTLCMERRNGLLISRNMNVCLYNEIITSHIKSVCTSYNNSLNNNKNNIRNTSSSPD